jgi:hypothetical protein
MNIADKNISEIDLIPIIEDLFETKSWNFKLSYSILKEYNREYFRGFFMRRIIFDSEWCRVRFDAYQRRNAYPDMYDVSIRYGRLHAPNESDFQTWQGETCWCWHSIGSSHLFFLEGVSPAEYLERPRLPEYGAVISTKYELGDFSPLARESNIWKYYGRRLFELFDLHQPDLWNRYVEYLKEYYRLREEDFRSRGVSPVTTDAPPLWKVC